MAHEEKRDVRIRDKMTLENPLQFSRVASIVTLEAHQTSQSLHFEFQKISWLQDLPFFRLFPQLEANFLS
jgi:hypothetical protein